DYLKAQRKAAGGVLQTVRLDRPDQIFESGTFSPSDVGPVGLTVVEFLLKQGGGAPNFGKFVQRVQAGERVDAVLKAVYNTDPRARAMAYGTAHMGSAAKKKK